MAPCQEARVSRDQMVRTEPKNSRCALLHLLSTSGIRCLHWLRNNRERERERENTTHEQWQSICHEIERKLAPVEVFLQKSCCFHRDRDPKIILYSVCVFRALSTLNTKLVQLIRPASNGQRKTTNHLHHRIFFLTVYPCHSTCVRLVYLFLYFICMISQSFRTDGNTEKDVTCRSRWAVRCLRPRLWISRRS